MLRITAMEYGDSRYNESAYGYQALVLHFLAALLTNTPQYSFIYKHTISITNIMFTLKLY